MLKKFRNHAKPILHTSHVTKFQICGFSRGRKLLMFSRVASENVKNKSEDVENAKIFEVHCVSLNINEHHDAQRSYVLNQIPRFVS
jgi:hypothetical protein